MKSTVKGNDALVQGTNDNSIVSKCSMATVGYFEDKFLQYFVAKNSRRSPLINRGYYIRAKAIDFALRLFLNSKASDKRQIISLGAGFDSSYFRLTNSGALSNTRFLEIDFPEVVRRKIKLIHATKELSHLIKDADCRFGTDFQNELISNDYSLIGCDLTDLSRLEKVINSIQFSNETRTLLLSEVVLTYVNNDSCSKLIQWAAKTFSNSVFLLYEQIHPEDAFGVVMKKHFTTLQSPLRCIDSYPTLESQVERFKALGWPCCDAMDMNEFYYNFVTNEERDRISNIEPFDEFEEWHLKCSHYTLVAAFSGSCCSLKEVMFPEDGKRLRKEDGKLPIITCECTNRAEETLKRFGHQLVQLVENKVLLTCGFGCSQNKHKRLRDGVIIDFAGGNESNHLVQRYSLFDKSKLFHTVVKLSDGSIFVFGGRESPLRPCLDYGIFKVDEKYREHCTAERFDETKPNNEVSIFSWKGELSPISPHEQERKEPSPRWRHSATRIFLKGKEFVLIFGGRSEHSFALSDCWVFSISEHTWQKIILRTDSGTQLQPRHSHSACLWGDDRLIISGGLNGDSQPLNSFEIFHLSNEGFRVETVTFTAQLPARYSHTSHIIDDDLWLIGGVNLSISADFLVVNLRNWQWREYNLAVENYSSTLAPLMLHNHSSFVRNNKEIVIIGGGGNCFSFGTHFNAGIICVDASTILLPNEVR